MTRFLIPLAWRMSCEVVLLLQITNTFKSFCFLHVGDESCSRNRKHKTKSRCLIKHRASKTYRNGGLALYINLDIRWV